MSGASSARDPQLPNPTGSWRLPARAGEAALAESIVFAADMAEAAEQARQDLARRNEPEPEAEPEPESEPKGRKKRRD